MDRSNVWVTEDDFREAESHADSGDVTEVIHKYVDVSTLRDAYQRIMAERKSSGDKPVNVTNIHEDVIDFIMPADREITGGVFGAENKVIERYYTLSASGERIDLTPGKHHPYFTGFCCQGHVVSNKDMRQCDHPGCGKILCPQDSYEYKSEKYKCKAHYRRWQALRALLFLLSFFFIIEVEE